MKYFIAKLPNFLDFFRQFSAIDNTQGNKYVCNNTFVINTKGRKKFFLKVATFITGAQKS